MATEYLDKTGLTYFWSKIKAWAKRFLASSVNYDTTNKKITFTRYDGTNDAEHVIDVVTALTIVSDGGGITDVSGKADKVTGATNGNFAGLDSSGNLTDSGKKASDFANASHTHGNIQSGGTLQSNDITIASGDKLVVTDDSNSGKIARTSVSFDGSTTTKALTQKGTFETFLQSSDISGKADKVSGATAGNVATLDATGNLVDSGKTLGVSVPANAVFTDTKNTAGSTDSSSKLFLVGATSQAANPQTYSQDTVYAGTDGHVYSNGKQAVNLSDSQALTNKTYNGYTLAGACAKAVDTSISSGSTSSNLPTSAAVASAISSAIQEAQVGAASFQGMTDIADDGVVSTDHWKFSTLEDYKKGWYWVVATAGTYAGNVCEAGDMIFCISDKSSSYSADDFDAIQTNLDIASITNGEIDTITAN